MTYSQTSACSVNQSRFYEDLESASEGFIYRTIEVEQKVQNKEKRRAKNSKNAYNTLKDILSCCFGNRQGKSQIFSIMGYEFEDVFDDATTVPASSDKTDTVIGYKKNDTLWAIEPSQRHKYLELEISEAKWLLLAWTSRIVKGENVNKNLLNSIIAECKVQSQKVSSITPNVIKKFPNLNLCEDVYEMEANDLLVALDNFMITLQNYVQDDKNTFAFIINKDACYAMYYTKQGSVDYTVLFEVKLFQEGEIHYLARFLAFETFEDIRSYLLSSGNIQNNTKLHLFFFNFRKLSIDWTDQLDKDEDVDHKGIKADSKNLQYLNEKESTDPKYDVKQLIKVLKSAQNS